MTDETNPDELELAALAATVPHSKCSRCGKTIRMRGDFLPPMQRCPFCGGDAYRVGDHPARVPFPADDVDEPAKE
jgi:uncharacterized protein (DUF983 family)